MTAFSRRSFLRDLSLVLGSLWRFPRRGHAASPGVPSDPRHLMWYRDPAKDWSQALPVGNGRLGATIFGDPRREHIFINEESFWSGEPKDFQRPSAARHLATIRVILTEEDGISADNVVSQQLLSKVNESYQPLAFLDLLHQSVQPEELSSYRRSLDLLDGVHSVEHDSPRAGHMRETIFVSVPDQVMVVRFETTSPGGLYSTIRLGSTMPNARHTLIEDLLTLEVRAPSHVVPSQIENAIGAVSWDDKPQGKGMRASVALCVLEQQGGRRSQNAEEIRIEGAVAVTLLLSAATSYNGPHNSPSSAGVDPLKLAVNALKKARHQGNVSTLLKRHVQNHRAMFDRVDLKLQRIETGKSSTSAISAELTAMTTSERLFRLTSGESDPDLVALYFQFARYLLMASSRPGSLPATTQGIWSHRMRPHRASAWLLNSDLPISYGLTEIANLSECQQPLFALAQRLFLDGGETAKNLYGCKGWVAHTSVDLWNSTAPDADNPPSAIWKSGGAWLCQHIWQHYCYCGDTAFLLIHYPIMREAAVFFLDHMVGDRDGWLGAYPESSLDNAYREISGHVAYSSIGPTMSTSIIRELLTSTYLAARVLNKDNELQGKLQSAAGQLRPLTVDRVGELQEWADSSWVTQIPPIPQVPQVWALAPGTQVNLHTNPEIARAMRMSLLNRAPWHNKDQGWASGWYAAAFARLEDGHMAYDVLREHLKAFAGANFISGTIEAGWDYEIAGNLGVATAIAEMLLQSHNDEIHFLPALPDEWATGSFRGLRARRGVEVDLEWNGGRATKAVLRSSLSSKQVLRPPKGQSITRVTGTQDLQRLEENRVRVDTRPGETYTVDFSGKSHLEVK